jgi:diaminohydroxyphosphoribosylaminopyrimidine deaminase/5-amino-6-(5-phosphoribosylamino)uracil reductase
LAPRSTDETYMKRALALARRGAGWVSPNPLVGAVVVRHGKIVGEGYHRRFGGPHAEIHALEAAGFRARASTLYITLEPCCHEGKTPPCTDRVIAAGVKEVVCGMVDPYPAVNGKGIATLRRKGVTVRIGVLEEECRHLNESYVWRLRTGAPFVTLKTAMTLDGKIADHSGESKWISSEVSRRRVQRLRYEVDAVLTGIGTVLADDPMLVPRSRRRKPHHLRIVLDPRGEIPLDSQLVRSAREFPLLVVISRRAGKRAKHDLTSRGVEILEVPSKGERLDLPRVLSELGQRPVNHILVEAGSRLAGSFLEQGLVNRLIVFVAPSILPDPKARPMAAVDRRLSLGDALFLKIESVRRSGPDIMITAEVTSLKSEV